MTAVFGQNGENESLKEQGLDDIEALSSLNYPYIEQFHEAIREKMSGNYSEAKKLFNTCLEEKQDDDAVYFGLAEIAKAEGDVSLALKNFKKAYELDQQNITYLQELTYMHYERGNFEEAEVKFKELCERQPRNIDFRYGYSKVLIYNKEYQSAINELDKLQDQTGIVPELMIMKADLYSELKKYNKAEETLLLLKDEFPQNKEILKKLTDFYKQQGEEEKAIEIIKELAAENPNNGMAQLVLAKKYLEEEKYEQFVEVAPKLIENKQIEVGEKIDLFNELKRLKGSENNLVIDAAEQLYSWHPKDYEVASNYIEGLLAQHKSKQALSIAREVATENPNHFEAWKMVFTIASDHLDYQALYEESKKALELFPTMPLVYLYAAEGALSTNRSDEAIQFLAAGELYLLDDKSKEALFSMRKGEIYFFNKNYKKGIVAFEKATSQAPSNSSIKVAYAWALSKANIAQSVAKEMLEQIEAKDKNRDYYRAKAQFSVNKNNLGQGIEALEEGVENVFNNAELLDFLGDLYFKNQEVKKALEHWKLAQDHQSRNKVLDQKINEEKFYASKYY